MTSVSHDAISYFCRSYLDLERDRKLLAIATGWPRGSPTFLVPGSEKRIE